MNILIAGASGFIGKELVNSLCQHHQITVLGRNLAKLNHAFSNVIQQLTWKDLTLHEAKNYHLIINLSGTSIGAKRWSSSVKKEIIESRTLTNQQLIEWLIEQNAKPRFFCANAIGIYGAEEIGTQSYDEYSILPVSSKDFLQQVGLAWEQSLKPAIEADIPVVTLRFGVVLKKSEGMLKKLELPYRLGVGSILGTGKQMLSWIHYNDLVNAIHFLIEHPDITGCVNLTAPFPTEQKKFATEFAKVLKRPRLFRMPSWFITLLFGEMGESLLLKGQKVIPQRLTELGFEFSYPDIKMALVQEYGGDL